MRLPVHALALAAVVALALGLTPKVHAASPVGEDRCTQVAPLMRVCAPQGGDPSYLIEQGGRQVRFVAVNDTVAVLPVLGQGTLRMISSPTAEQMSGLVPLKVRDYKDDTVEITLLQDRQDSQQRWFWMVRLLTAPKLGRLQLMCAGSDCSGSKILLSIE